MCVWQDEMAIYVQSLLCICISPGRTCTHGRLDGRPTPTTACGLHTGKRAGRETIDRVFAVPELDGYLRFSCLSFVPFSDSICLQHTRARALLLTRSIVRRRRPGHMGGRGALALPRRGRRSGRRGGGRTPPSSRHRCARVALPIEAAISVEPWATRRARRGGGIIWQTRPPDMHAWWCSRARVLHGITGKREKTGHVCMFCSTHVTLPRTRFFCPPYCIHCI